MNKIIARQVLDSLDKTAGEIEKLKVAGLVNSSVAARIISNIDTSADRIQVAAYGPRSFAVYRAQIAKVLKQDPDEPYMKTFDNPIKPIVTETDEPYMHKAPSSFNAKGIDTFDLDPSSQMTERDEYDIREVSPLADGTKKQPSWARSPAGKSTKQGSTRQVAAKTWAS